MDDLEKQLSLIQASFDKELSEVAGTDDLERMRITYLGKKGNLTSVLRQMGQLSPERRPVVGKTANVVREHIETRLTQRNDELKEQEEKANLYRQSIDVTLPPKRRTMGARHPIYQAMDEICDVFIGMGFFIAEGPEIEYDSYHFEMLRIPKGHPARDTQDTFYITDSTLLRAHTSAIQVRVMKDMKPPIKVLCPGKVYRSDTIDSTHSPIFHQVEGLVVDKGVTMGDLVGSLKLFAKALFGENTDIRLRPHHFPYTEPSCEVDLTCWACGGKGCRVCKNEGWIEVLGAGMVHPEVLENCGIDATVYSGFAFGIGGDRTAMGRYGVDDIRLFFENDIRFLRQFK